MAILSIKGKWLHFKDASPTTAPWPRGGKDVLLLFYHVKSTVAPTGKASTKDIGRRKYSHSTTAQPQTIFARTRLTRMTTGATTTTTTTTTHTTTTTEPTTVTTAPTTTSTISTKTHTTATCNASGCSSQNTLIFTYCKGFTNNDGVSCYANSILQCLLQHRSVRNAWVGSRYFAFRNLANDYVDPTKLDLLSCRPVRKLL